MISCWRNLSNVNFGQMDRIMDGGQRQLLKKWYPSEWMVSGAVGLSKGRWRERDKRRGRRGRKRQRGYKGSSRRLPLGDGSQMSDPGPLQLIVKQKPYLLFLSVSYFLHFALFLLTSPFSFSLWNLFSFMPALCLPTLLLLPSMIHFSCACVYSPSPRSEGRCNLCCPQMANTT